MNYKDLVTFDTTLTADAVQWRPKSEETNKNNILACGTYYLNKHTTQRTGSLHLLDITTTAAIPLTRLDYSKSGILDFRWLNQECILTIDSSNSLDLLVYNQPEATLQFKSNLKLSNDDDSIGLLIDFTGNPGQSLFKILTSDTKGRLYLTNISNERLETFQNFKAHDLETWTVHIDRFDQNLIYSGADDCTLKMWDIRETRFERKPVLQWSLFDGGVTCITQAERHGKLLSGYTQDSVVCGSYDEKILVLDKRNAKQAVRESKKMGGGVWRIKLHEEKDLFVCACMHVGAFVVDGLNLESRIFYDGHGIDNLVYGCDWNGDLVATCSFYNHELRVWKVEDLI